MPPEPQSSVLPLHYGYRMAEARGLEPPATRLTAGCSTVELRPKMLGADSRNCTRYARLQGGSCPWRVGWSQERGSNPQPHAYHACALPSELPRLEPPRGIEPLTHRLRSDCPTVGRWRLGCVGGNRTHDLQGMSLLFCR